MCSANQRCISNFRRIAGSAIRYAYVLIITPHTFVFILRKLFWMYSTKFVMCTENISDSVRRSVTSRRQIGTALPPAALSYCRTIESHRFIIIVNPWVTKRHLGIRQYTLQTRNAAGIPESKEKIQIFQDIPNTRRHFLVFHFL